MVISLSGDVDPDEAFRKLTKTFAALKPGELPKTKVLLTPQDKLSVKNIVMEKEQSLVVLGFVTTNLKDPDRYALELLGSVLSGCSGRLFEALRNRSSLAYTLGSAQKAMVDTGFFALYAATTKDKIPAVREGLIKEVNDIRRSGITDEELANAKRELKAGFDIKKQTNAFFSQTTALDELYGLGYDNIFKYGPAIDRVTKEDVRRVADKYFDLNRYSEIVISGEK